MKGMTLSAALFLLASVTQLAAGSAAVRKRVKPSFALPKDESSEFGRSLQTIFSYGGAFPSFLSMSMSFSMSMSMSTPVPPGPPPGPPPGIIDGRTGEFLPAGSPNSQNNEPLIVSDTPLNPESEQMVSSLYERSCSNEQTGSGDTAVVPYAFEIEISSAPNLNEQINSKILDSVAEQVLECLAPDRRLKSLSLGGNTIVEKVNIINEQDGSCIAESNENQCIVKEGYLTIAFTSDYPSTTADQLIQITTKIIKEDIGALASLPGVARTSYLDPPENLAPLATSSSSPPNEEEGSSGGTTSVMYLMMGFYAAVTVAVVFLFVYTRASKKREQENDEREIDGKEQVDDAATEASEYGELTEVVLSP